MMKYLAMLMAILLTGCASLGNLFADPSSQQTIAKLAVQYATLKAIKNSPERAAGVTSIVEQALAFVEGGEDPVISPEQLQVVLTEVLPDSLDAADKILASTLIALVVQEIGARIPAGQAGIPVAEISVVLGWVQEAAALVTEPTPAPEA